MPFEAYLLWLFFSVLKCFMVVLIVLPYRTIIKHLRETLRDSSLVCFSFKKRKCSFDFEMCETFSPYSFQSITALRLEMFHGLHFPKHICILYILWHSNGRSNKNSQLNFKWFTKNRSSEVDEASVKIYDAWHFVNLCWIKNKFEFLSLFGLAF